MGVVTLPSSASHISTKISLRLKLGPTARTNRPGSAIAFKSDRTKCSAVVATKSTAQVPVPVERLEKERAKVGKKRSEKRKVEQQEGSLDYNEVAAALENIYKQSAVREDNVVRSRKPRRRRRNVRVGKRLSDEEEEEERLIREYSVSSNDLVSMDWKKMKIPPVLSMPEQRKLFKFMQPMKEILEVKEKLQIDLKKEVTDGELATAVNMTVPQLRMRVKVGQAARNKLIRHNLRLVIFAINKYYQDMASGDKFQDLCQAGVKGLITAIDRFEHKRGFHLSTYALFWIRHSIVRSMTTSSFTRVSFGIESIRQEIQKAKLELICELDRMPTEEETISRVGISAERYYDVTRASKTVFSLNSRHIVTQEEFINQITDVDADVGGDKRRQPALLRLALDDVLDSLKPKESLVIRQRYGLDGKGDRTLGEIAGNLNISREMVRKHELKALMKLKNPARLDYLRRHI